MIFIQAIASLALRVALALPFYQSGLTKWDGPLQLSSSTIFLFENLYKPTLFGTTYDMPFPVLAAWAASLGEILLPAALVIGFATRLSALGLLVMTGVIFSTYTALGVDPGTWQKETLPWGAMALALVAYGPGWLSFDKLIQSAWRSR
ncbi:DoxX family protein [Bauldia sp.]|uniref:DoxX family protein n=1 Tax=Bauldia sp. TaxID=2575872 RepID=UPI003BA86EDB